MKEIILFIFSLIGISFYTKVVQKQKDINSEKRVNNATKKIKEKYEKANMDNIYPDVNNKYS